MPTENRSSTIEQHDHIEGIIHMVSVPRELAERIQLRLDHAASAFKAAKPERDQFRAILARPAPQPHPEPIAWMVGTAIWWTKEEAERDAAEVGLPVVGLGPMTGSSVPAVSIPDGYCLMPRRLTAENGAKALLLGEFKLEVTRECPECLELDDPAEGCEICDGEGEFAQRHTIPWDQIKFIYSEAVKGLALQPNTAR
ncbi:hypothetical protein I5S62_05930 [Pseudomonas putida]|uniref:hypothetical protein n=1 Tax=Pseudomonas putida TaxID=303 RepID=UPI0018D84753|nr:hypothetical protein [Pseudomonas putida]ELU0814291.1 hypothetical protein [Pseudomonas putida]MBH3388656.1 hypothetical protein [Pseudomonas putida]